MTQPPPMPPSHNQHPEAKKSSSTCLIIAIILLLLGIFTLVPAVLGVFWFVRTAESQIDFATSIMEGTAIKTVPEAQRNTITVVEIKPGDHYPFIINTTRTLRVGYDIKNDETRQLKLESKSKIGSSSFSSSMGGSFVFNPSNDKLNMELINQDSKTAKVEIYTAPADQKSE